MYEIQINEKGMSSYSVDNSDSKIKEEKKLNKNPNNTKYKTILNNIYDFKCNKDIANIFSYGIYKGSFNLNEKDILNFSKDKDILKNFALRERKTEFYRLIWDFDFKVDKNPILNDYIKIADKIVEKIICYIIQILKEYFDLSEDQVKYIYAGKNEGIGMHVYFYNIIINCSIHRFIFYKVIELLIKNKDYPEEVIDKIFDVSITDSNGLRLFYFEKDNNFYYPIKDKSTFDFDEKADNLIKYSLLRTNNTEINIKIKEIYDIKIINKFQSTKSKQLKISKPKIAKKEDEKSNEEENDNYNFEINNSVNIDFLSDKQKKELIIKLGNLISSEKLDDYNCWINIVMAFRIFNLKYELLTICKKSSKFDREAEKAIFNIFKKKYDDRSKYIVAKLIYWAADDNLKECIKIIEEYNIQLDLKIKSSDDILLFDNKNKFNYKEESKYISDIAINKMLEEIKKSDGNKVLLLKSPTGSGKTTCISKIITEIKPESILAITSRRSMIATLQNSLKDLNLVSYLDDAANQNKFISSLEYLASVKESKYDILILDEVNSLLTHYWSDTMVSKRLDSIIKLCNLIKNSKLIIAADANVTEMVFKFFDNLKIGYFFYLNSFKNKLGKNMNIYTSKSNSEDTNIFNFCELFKKDVKDGRSVLIFSDSRKLTIKIQSFLLNYNSDLNYYLIFNKDSGNLKDLNDCNNTFLNKCVICSPRVVYGLDILIKYKQVYMIYKNTAGYFQSMNALEYHQQINRSRNAENVNILINNSFNKFKNKFISFEKSCSEENKIYAKHKEEYTELAKKYQVVNELCSCLSLDGELSINKESLFANIFYIKTYFDKLFFYNKLDIIKLLSIEAGFTIIDKELEIIKTIKSSDDAIKAYDKKIKKVTKKILNNQKITEQHEKQIAVNTHEQIEARKKILLFDGLNYESMSKLLVDPEKFQTYINRKYLQLNKENFEKIKIKINSSEIPQLIKDNKILNKIKVLFDIEEKINFERFDVNNIKLNDKELENAKKYLTDKIKDICLFFSGDKSNRILEERKKNKISNIITTNQLQKFIVDLYNSFGDIFKVSTKIKRINVNKVKVQMTIFKFSLN